MYEYEFDIMTRREDTPHFVSWGKLSALSFQYAISDFQKFHLDKFSGVRQVLVIGQQYARLYDVNEVQYLDVKENP